MAALAHRIEVAKANNNLLLVQLLEQEKQQVDPPAPTASARLRWWTALRQVMAQLSALMGHTRLEVLEFANGSDHWWYAFDPETGRCVYADSEAELRLWIKENYHGK